MKQGVRERTLENINRAKNLINIYERTNGNSSEQYTDILRAAVVLLHTALEDCIRSISYLKLPFASSNELYKTEHKVHLGKIAEYRDKAVDELISDMVFEHLERATYNNSEGISKALKSLGIDIDKSDISKLDPAIRRRHGIVHRADRGDKDGETGRISPIKASYVSKWVEEVERFVGLVFDKVDGTH